jgi:hypothetical protein
MYRETKLEKAAFRGRTETKFKKTQNLGTFLETKLEKAAFGDLQKLKIKKMQKGKT